MSTQVDDNRLRAAIIQRRVQIAISTALYVNTFLPIQYVHTSSRTGRRYTAEILRAHPRRVMKLIRMPITTFLDLRDWIVERGLLSPSRHISVEEQLVTFLWTIGHGASNRETQEQFQHSGETISR